MAPNAANGVPSFRQILLSDISAGTQTQNYAFMAPSGSSGSPSFRAIVAADIPTLNQSTTGTAAGFTVNLSGDVTGTQSATSVVKVNGLAVPPSKTVVGTNSSGQFVDATSSVLTVGDTTTFWSMGPNPTTLTSSMVIFGPVPVGTNMTIPANGTNSNGTSRFILGTLPTASWVATIYKIQERRQAAPELRRRSER